MNRKYVGISLGLCFGSAVALGTSTFLSAAPVGGALGVAFGFAFGFAFGAAFGAAGGAASDAAVARKKLASDQPLPRPLGL